MSKSVLILDTPKSCAVCPMKLNHDKEERLCAALKDSKGEKVNIGKHLKKDLKKSPMCPLIALSKLREKADVNYITTWQLINDFSTWLEKRINVEEYIINNTKGTRYSLTANERRTIYQTIKDAIENYGEEDVYELLHEFDEKEEEEYE